MDVYGSHGLEELATTSESALGRMHALWTLDGLKAATRDVIGKAIGESDLKVSLTALRTSETLLAKDPALVRVVGDAGYDSDDMLVVVQVINSLRFAMTPEAKKLIADIASAYPGSDIVMTSSQSSLNYREGGGGQSFANFHKNMLAKMQNGYQANTMTCIRCPTVGLPPSFRVNLPVSN